MERELSDQSFFLVIHCSSIKSFILTELLISTAIYVGIKFMSHNEWISFIGCLVGTEAYKRMLIFYRNTLQRTM
ncbi:hypothetical protein CJ195_01725 [Bacillus sp. UMB0899]|nr:hypothetical protein CJ195_01725 [Bacillus sp. UMB0899]